MTTIETNWDKTLKIGTEAEELFTSILRAKGFIVETYGDGKQKGADKVVNGIPVEIKNDVMAERTGNFAFEIRFRGKPSGISSTKAKLFVYITDKQFYCFRVDELQEFIRTNWKSLRKVMGGDSNESQLVLVRMADVSRIVWCVFGVDGVGVENLLLTNINV